MRGSPSVLMLVFDVFMAHFHLIRKMPLHVHHIDDGNDSENERKL
jgi:hypothetical protein